MSPLQFRTTIMTDIWWSLAKMCVQWSLAKKSVFNMILGTNHQSRHVVHFVFICGCMFSATLKWPARKFASFNYSGAPLGWRFYIFTTYFFSSYRHGVLAALPSYIYSCINLSLLAPLTILRASLDPLSFYKNYFLAITHKNWFFKKMGKSVWRPDSKNCKSIFIEQFLKIGYVSRPIFKNMTVIYVINLNGSVSFTR
jgi:hypothetical protein